MNVDSESSRQARYQTILYPLCYLQMFLFSFIDYVIYSLQSLQMFCKN